MVDHRPFLALMILLTSSLLRSEFMSTLPILFRSRTISHGVISRLQFGNLISVREDIMVRIAWKTNRIDRSWIRSLHSNDSHNPKHLGHFIFSSLILNTRAELFGTFGRENPLQFTLVGTQSLYRLFMRTRRTVIT